MESPLFRYPRFTAKDLAPVISNTTSFGFSGSRERCFPKDKEVVFEIVDVLPLGSTVVSGQCNSTKTVTVDDPSSGKEKEIKLVNENTDRWSVARAASRGLSTKEFPPTYPGLESIKEQISKKMEDPRAAYWYITNRNYARNIDIVDNSGILFALVPREVKSKSGSLVKKSGSWHTVKYALSKGKPVYVNLDGEEGWILVSKIMLNSPTIMW